MSVYDRAPRKTLPLYGSTTPAVGPGSYEQVYEVKSKNVLDGYAPFMSMSLRDNAWAGETLISAPGPGHYDPQMVPEKVPGGFALQSTTARFNSVASDNPGPGTYNVLQPDQTKFDKILLADKLSGGGRIKLSRKPEAPSIPTPGQAYGFEEGDDGSLMRQDPPKRDTSIGPAFYKPQAKSSKFNSIKTNNFGRGSKRPDLFQETDVPGPGTYGSVESDAAVIMQNLNIRDHDRLRFESHIPRFSDATVMNAYKQGIPGPGKYNIHSGINMEELKYTTEGLEVEHPPFMSQSSRFKPTRDANPGPGTYTDPRHALENINRVSGLKRSPFGQTAVRFEKQSRHKLTPGPGSYNFPGIGAESMRKAYLDSTQHGVFGTTSARRTGLTMKNDAQLPGPAQYKVKDLTTSTKNKFQNLTANFASITNRIPEPPAIITEIPPPTTYDVHKSYENSQVKCRRAKPRTKAANRKQRSFLLGTSRFGPVCDSRWNSVEPNNPAPCSYDPSSEQHVSAALMTKTNRFKFNNNGFPGPGTYELPVAQRDTVIKGTFNATLTNPVAIEQTQQNAICA